MTLSQSEFTYVSTMVRREASIVLAPGKEYLVEARLIPVARAVGAANVNEFLAELQRRPDPANQRRIIDALCMEPRFVSHTNADGGDTPILGTLERRPPIAEAKRPNARVTDAVSPFAADLSHVERRS